MKKLLLLAVSFLVMTGVYAQWQSNPALNTAIAVAPGDQVVTKIATHPSGITYYAWYSLEGGNYNVRLQKTDLYGNIKFGPTGLLISNHTSDTWVTDFGLAVDNDTCAVVALQDIRTGSSEAYAYRISPNGVKLWGNDGIRLTNSSAADYSPMVTITTEGNAVITWEESSSFERVIMQKISPSGQKLWGDGVILQGSNQNNVFPRTFSAPDDKVFLLWFKKGTGLYDPKYLYAQKFNADGTKAWASDMPVYVGSGVSMIPSISYVNDLSGGFYVAWYDDRNNDLHYSTFIQYLNDMGEPQFTVNGIEAIVNNSNHHTYPSITLSPDGNDLYVFVVEMDGNQNNRGLYGQRLSSSGQRLWANSGKMFIGLSSLDVGMLTAQMADTNVVVVYFKNSGSGSDQVKAMKVDKNGSYLWPSGGHIMVSSSNGLKDDLVVGQYNFGQFIAAWCDQRSDNGDIYAQNITTAGTLGAQQVFTLQMAPDTLVFDQTYSFEGKYFALKNPTLFPVTINSMEMMDFITPGCGWMVDTVLNFPCTIPPGDSLWLNVKLLITVNDFPDGFASDIIDIQTSIGHYGEVLLIDSVFLFNSGSHPGSSGAVTLYPNPASGIVNMICDEKDQAESVSLLDNPGRRLKTWDFTGRQGWNIRQLDISGFPPGNYLLLLKYHSGRQEIRKLVLVR